MTMIKRLDQLGDLAVAVFHRLALFAIGIATVTAASTTFLKDIVDHGNVGVGDLLLMFIYLEIGAMVGIYFKTNHMPVRFLMYIAITALTRHTVEIMSHAPINTTEMLAVSVATLLFTLSVLIMRFASNRYPANDKIV